MCLVVIITVTISKCCCNHFISFIDIVVKATISKPLNTNALDSGLDSEYVPSGWK